MGLSGSIKGLNTVGRLALVLILGTGAVLAYARLVPLIADYDTYRRVEVEGRVRLSTATGRLLLRVDRGSGDPLVVTCSARPRSGACFRPAIQRGLRDGDVARVTYLSPPASAWFQEPVVLQIADDRRAYLDCGQRLHELRLDPRGDAANGCRAAF
ncbi:hypothetical protein ACPVPU_04640 [Sphingomonas sp. CJ99]